MKIYEDSDVDDDFGMKWPNEKMLWWRLIACVLVGAAIAVGLFIGVVMLVNKYKEDRQNKSGVSIVYKGKNL